MKGILVIPAVVVFVCGTVLWGLSKTNTTPVSQNEFKVTVTYEKFVTKNNKGMRTLVRKPKLNIKRTSTVRQCRAVSFDRNNASRTIQEKIYAKKV